MKIRWYEYGNDLDFLTAIDKEWSEEDFKKKLRQKAITCLVATKEDKVIGFLVYEIFLHRFTVLRIGVCPLHRRKKVATALMNNLVEKLTPGKRTLISVDVRESNLTLQLFLKALHYQAIEVIRKHFPDTKEDCFVFHFSEKSHLPS